MKKLLILTMAVMFAATAYAKDDRAACDEHTKTLLDDYQSACESAGGELTVDNRFCFIFSVTDRDEAIKLCESLPVPVSLEGCVEVVGVEFSDERCTGGHCCFAKYQHVDHPSNY